MPGAYEDWKGAPHVLALALPMVIRHHVLEIVSVRTTKLLIAEPSLQPCYVGFITIIFNIT